MRKYISILILVLIVLQLYACSSDSDKIIEQDTTITSNVSTTHNNDDYETLLDEHESDNNSSNTTVLIRCFRQRKELSCDVEIKDWLDSIKECNDKPKTELTKKIGSITIRHTGDEASERFADIYLGNDENVYAQYINSDSDKTAYKLDTEKLGLE